MRPSTRPLAALATVVTGVGFGVVTLAPAAQADTTTVTYFYSGGQQTFAIPPNVTHLHVDAVGGQGGRSTNAGNTDFEPGGAGARISADINVTPNTTLFVEVGGNGQNGDNATTTAAGGWNGGGAGEPYGGGGGGGASDVRTVSASSTGSLGSRLLVAGGGGGAAFGAPGGASGSAGGADDPNCSDHGGPGDAGTSSAIGTGGSGSNGEPGGFAGGQGVGGNGGSASTGAKGGGGGGGGEYGGGGGGAGQACGGGGGGGGNYLAPGSTFSSPVADFGNRTWITISYVIPMTPLVTTTPASDIGQTSATLNGVLTPETVTPPDSGALCYFEYGTDQNYGMSTLGGPCGQGMDQVYFWDSATSLLPGTTYHFRLAASNRYGYSYGNDMQFTTLSPPPPAPAPSATTSPATNIGWHKATLHGVVNPQGYATTYHFDYGKTASYGKSTASRSAGNGSSNVNVQAALSSLPRHTAYHFRIVAVNVNGTTTGADMTFRTR